MNEIKLPHTKGMDFGVGIDRLSGSKKNLVVSGEPSGVQGNTGIIESFEVSRVTSTSDLQTKLGVDVNASYGCASFGAGISARFNYLSESSVQTTSLFLSITATITLSELSIDHCVLTNEAKEVVNKPEVFASRYGNMFCRACSRGGLFVGLMRVETSNQDDVSKIEAELKGSYGAFSAEVKFNFQETLKKYNAQVYCTVYKEGGPPIRIDNPADATSLLNQANLWIEAFHNEPEKNSIPYEWLLSPVEIAEGPIIDTEKIKNAQDVLLFCARERTTTLDQLNLLLYINHHPEKFDFSNSVSREEIVKISQAVQTDLETLTDTASLALTEPSLAVFPDAYAKQKSKTYPSVIVPENLPKPKTGVVVPATPATHKPFDPRLLERVRVRDFGPIFPNK
ncbi:hypothetical protein [Bacillus thuringiensis]|uniref:hypothetical protein n=1 Tax=Bacillus thuringiensis TaxID=1428 RepID=UPI000BFBCC09|nr:hypothetical protein [Bacillus thuringiensis]KAB2364575.1 hypothetical protein F8517_23840 [Bacillus thuringiensis]PGT62894.1 hypothetical protein COD16_08590 [Bacillus thuringiensis]